MPTMPMTMTETTMRLPRYSLTRTRTTPTTPCPPADVLATFHALRAEGSVPTLTAIAQRCGVSRNTVRERLRAAGVWTAQEAQHANAAGRAKAYARGPRPSAADRRRRDAGEWKGRGR